MTQDVQGHSMDKKQRPTKLEIEQRREQVAELLVRRYTLRQIAAALGVSKSLVHKDKKEIFKALKERQQAHIQELYLLDLQATEQAVRELVRGPVMAGDPAGAQALVRVLERRAKMLGYDAPAQHEVAGKGGGPIESKVATSIDLSMASDAELAFLRKLLGADEA